MNTKAVRELLGLSQQKFADLIGVHKMTVCAWEYGKCNPSLKNQSKIIGRATVYINEVKNQEAKKNERV